MFRRVWALATCLLLASSVSAADPKKLEIRWHGQSFFEIKTSKGTRIVFDPHAIEAYGRKVVEADLVLVSHLHNDHTQLGVISNRSRKEVLGLKLVGKRWDWNLLEETFRDVRLRTVGVYHDSMQGMERGKNAVFVLEVDGLKIVHLGDLGHLLTADQIKQIGPVDILMIPVGGVYTINGSEAKQVVQQLKPTRYILPMHYGTKVYDDLLPIDEFRDEQKNVKELVGNLLTVEADAKPPAEPTIAILGWK
jgi:L-ascorbate metabolism protein UlaG (beta-lactamase superfamily)